MARRLIGLDVGTNAVTVAEVSPGTPPRLEMFAQVALPRDAMREGEIADEAAVTDAVMRLRNEVGLKKAAVRIGVASPRVVVRQIEMPVMSRDELASALQFQAGDLIPIPLDEAVLDFAILGAGTPHPDGGEPTMQVLLAAAYESTVVRLVSAVEAGGLQVAAVDLVPLALVRALARPVPALVPAAVGAPELPPDGVGAEGIVSFGGGVTAIAVHEDGVPRFVRVLGSGGRELTDAIAGELGVPADTAEALKRALGQAQPDEMIVRARTAVDRPLSVLLDDVRSSIDYYRNQPGAARLQRVIVTGGSAQLPGLPERLSALVGVPVEPAYTGEVLTIGDIGFPPDELPRLEPYLPAPVGLALGGANIGTIIDIAPTRRRAATSKVRGLDRRIIAGATAAVVVLGGLTFMAHESVSSAKSKQNAAEAEAKKLSSQLAYSRRGQVTKGATGPATKGEVASVLASDVAWQGMVEDVAAQLPPGVWLTSFGGQRSIPTAAATGAAGGAAGAPGTATAVANQASANANATANAAGGAASSGAAGSGGAAAAAAPGIAFDTSTGAVQCASIASVATPSGTVTMAGIATDVPALTKFIDNLRNDPDVTQVWMSSAQKQKSGSTDTIAFTMSAQLASGARGHRLETFFGSAPCK